MKKILKLLILLLIAASFNCVSAQEQKKLAVFPVDIEVQGSSFGIFPNILSLISADLVNTLNKNFISVYDLSASEDSIKVNKLSKTYNNFLKEYKTSYTFDYDSAALIAKKLGASRILLVSGGVDPQNNFLRRSFISIFSIPGLQTLNPSYRLNIMLTLIDAQSGLVEWEKTYQGNVRVSSNGVPSINISENLVSLEDIKKFSEKLSNKATKEIVKIITIPILNVESKILPGTTQKLEEIPKLIPKIEFKDGNMTKDGPSIPSTDTYTLKRKNKYKNWIKEQLSN